MRNVIGVIGIIVVGVAVGMGSAGCGGTNAMELCKLDADGPSGQSCDAPEDPPTNGYCIAPRGQGEHCYHSSNCASGLICVLPAGLEEGGVCKPFHD